MKPIKETRSVCPICLDELSAKIFEKKDGIWMYKQCKKHGKFQGLIEKDPIFYQKTTNTKNIKYESIPLIFIAITHRCNLNCNFCFIENKKRRDMSIEKLKKTIEKLPYCHVCISGGEPTLREDIFDIISILKSSPKISYVVLATNGIKLADRSYVKKLKKTGLNAVLLSFNGLTNKPYIVLNNRKLLHIKLKALENLKYEKILTTISSIFVKGLNEGDLKKIIEYILTNQFPFYQLRMRSVAKVGIHPNIPPLYCSEMLDMVAKALGLTKEFFLKDLPNKNYYFHSPYQFNLRLIFIETKNTRKLIYWDHGFYSNKKIILSKKIVFAFLKIIVYTLLQEGPWHLIKSLRGFDGLLGLFYNQRGIGLMGKIKNVKAICINIWNWPDRDNIDLNDIDKFEVKHLTFKGDCLTFWNAMIRSEEL